MTHPGDSCTGCGSPADRFCKELVRAHPRLGRLSLRHLCAQPICDQCSHRAGTHVPNEIKLRPAGGSGRARTLGERTLIEVRTSNDSVTATDSLSRSISQHASETAVGLSSSKPSRKELARQRDELVELLRDLEEGDPAGHPSPTAVQKSVSSSHRRVPRWNRNG